MQGITARVRYSKTGLTRFIGHLDTARALLRAVRRTAVEALYTQGFTPRLCLSFGPPLPLGLTSDCEYMDIKLARRYDPETLKEKLQSRLPEGLTVEEVDLLEETPSVLQTAFSATEYEISLGDQGLGSGVRDQGMGAGVSSPAEAAPECSCAAGQEETASASPVPTGESAIVDLCWREQVGDVRVLSVTVRHDIPGGRIKDVVRRLLGIEGPALNTLRIHKRRVFRRGERPPTSLSETGPNPAIGGIPSQR